MPVQINEVIVRAIITGESNNTESSSTEKEENVSSVTKSELIEVIDEVINDKKER